ncbi:MAG TPA: alpha/beta hydrolase [Xanthobacteraceae bacterium]|nr:alpha/beta hydrolase [Xanthobacteraceae bacterium]
MIDPIHIRRVDTGRITLNVREVGSGPLVVFLHGITSNAAVWDPIMLALAGEFRCVAVDQRGHGLSDKPAEGYKAGDLARDVLALIDTLKAGPAVIVGHSLGARNAVVAATIDPQLVKSVVAVDFTPFIEKEVLDTLAVRVNGGDRLFKSREEIEAYLQDRYQKMPAAAIRQRAMTAFREVEGGLRPLADPGAMAQTAEGLREELETAFKAVSRPTLVVRGAESKLVSEAALEKTRQLRPDMPVIVVENTDHYVTEEAPEESIRFIREFARA